MTSLLVDQSGAPVARSRWRTYVVLADTLVRSGTILMRMALRGEDQAMVDRTIRAWSARCFRVARASLVAEGMEHIDADTPCVLLSNHGSLLDIPAVILPFPGRLRFVAKQELRAVPLFGRAMERAGVVFVDREHREKAIAQLAAARQRLSEGTSVWVAVEGRRTPDGSVGKFKKGGFHVALQLGVPIVPTWIEGTVDVLAPDQWVSVTGQTVRVRFGEPIPTRGVDLDELMARTRAAMLALAGASA